MGDEPICVVGGYSLDLYCQYVSFEGGAVVDAAGHEYGEFPHQYTGQTFSQCVKKARADGWIINTARYTAACPKCREWHHRRNSRATK